jgi:hypothetical protein
MPFDTTERIGQDMYSTRGKEDFVMATRGTQQQDSLTVEELRALEAALIASGPSPDDLDDKLAALGRWAQTARSSAALLEIILQGRLMVDVLDDGEPIFREMEEN